LKELTSKLALIASIALSFLRLLMRMLFAKLTLTSTKETTMNPELAQALRELEESTARMLEALTRPILLESKLESAVSDFAD
jgi:hypothetical protein